MDSASECARGARRVSGAVLFAGLVALVAMPLRAQAPDSARHGGPAARPHAIATRATSAIVLDGRLDDAAWSAAPADNIFLVKISYWIGW